MKLLKRFGLVLVGIIGSFLMIEIILQICGLLSPALFERGDGPLIYTDDACRIVCLGDSWTYGLGVDAQENYPAYLQRMLDEKSGKGRFKVYNLGFPNFTSAMAVRKFSEVKDSLKPNIVIAMIGRSDGWNLDSGLRPLGIRDIFLNSKTVKLINIILFNIRQQQLAENKFPGKDNPQDLMRAEALVGKANELRLNQDYGAADEYYAAAIKAAPGFYLPYLEKAIASKLRGNEDEALVLLEKALLSDPSSQDAAREARDIFIALNDPQRAADYFLSLYNRDPLNSYFKGMLVNAYIVLADRCFIEKRFYDTVEIYDKALCLSPDEPRLHESLAYNQAILNIQGISLAEHIEYQKKRKIKNPHLVHPFLVDDKLRYNLVELVKMCRGSGIEVIISGYPREVFPGAVAAAQDCGVIFVDQMSRFQQLPGDLFLDDGHCNSEGNRLVAENLLEPVLLMAGKKHDVDKEE